jgi:subtilase family serine protease
LDAKIGDKITITAKVDNQGIEKAINPRITLYIDGIEVDSADVPDIDIDSEASVDFSWTVTAGEHEISVIANSDNAVLESNVSNNVKSRSISFDNPTTTVKKSAGLPIVSSTGKGFLNSWWWLLLLLAALLGVGAFVTAMRTQKKKY